MDDLEKLSCSKCKYNLQLEFYIDFIEKPYKMLNISEEELENSDMEHSASEDLKDEKPKKKKRRRREIDMVSKEILIDL